MWLRPLFFFSSLSPPSATSGKQWFILDSGCFSGPNNSVWDPTQDSYSTIGTLPFVISTSDKYWCDKMRCKLVPMSCNLLNIDRFGGRSCEILSGRGVSRELIREGKRSESWAHFLTNCISSKKEIVVSITTGKSNACPFVAIFFHSLSSLRWSVCNNNFSLCYNLFLLVKLCVCPSVCLSILNFCSLFLFSLFLYPMCLQWKVQISLVSLIQFFSQI